jgi:hypothetical protein
VLFFIGGPAAADNDDIPRFDCHPTALGSSIQIDGCHGVALGNIAF